MEYQSSDGSQYEGSESSSSSSYQTHNESQGSSQPIDMNSLEAKSLGCCGTGCGQNCVLNGK